MSNCTVLFLLLYIYIYIGHNLIGRHHVIIPDIRNKKPPVIKTHIYYFFFKDNLIGYLIYPIKLFNHCGIWECALFRDAHGRYFEPYMLF